MMLNQKFVGAAPVQDQAGCDMQFYVSMSVLVHT
jgi:hypothetical protein